MSTLCHELAHIKHMNHGPAFQKLWAQLRREVKALQDKGYYGDGYWSSGTRLSDSAPIGGKGVADLELPEYVCGGAQRRARPKSLKRRRQYTSSEPGPSTKRRKPKPGARVRAKGKFKGEGKALNADISDEEEKKKGTGFRKQAGSKRAREERALAVEKRMRALQGLPVKEENPDSSDTMDSDTDDEETIPETDENRLKIMRESTKEDNDELNSMRHFMKDYLEESSRKGTTSDVIKIPSDDDAVRACSLPSTSNPVSSKAEGSFSKASRMPKANDKEKSLRFGDMVKDEISFRRRESLGLVGERTLGSAPNRPSQHTRKRSTPDGQSSPLKASSEEPWSCLVCTLENQPMHLSCSICGSERGKKCAFR